MIQEKKDEHGEKYLSVETEDDWHEAQKRMSSGQVVKAQKLAGKLFKRIESSKARKRKFYRQMLNTRYMDAVLSAVRQSKTNQEGDTADVRFLKNGAAAAVRTLRATRPAAAPTDRVITLSPIQIQRRFGSPPPPAPPASRRA